MEKSKSIFNALPENEKLALIEKVMPHSGTYRQLDNSGYWTNEQWGMLADEFINSIHWDQGEELEKICVHDKSHIINGESDLGNKYQAIGLYSDDDLIFIEDLEHLI